MITPLTIISLDQGKLTPPPRSIGEFDAHLLEDIGHCACTVIERKALLRNRVGNLFMKRCRAQVA